ncbi:MAG: imidazole glycerol phosphate synthase subunit HisF [Armatimonadetes bacterium]|nr:imidazole glycerol phosphate synthase subunit HisF [Armatimonadota bacterium]
MFATRVIPVLLLQGTRLVKTTKFREPRYLGDPRNAVRIYNEREVDELVLLDIQASLHHREPDLDLIKEIVSEAFMPVAYGGGIKSLEQARSILQAGVEKVVFSTAAVEDPEMISRCCQEFGAQSVVACIDVHQNGEDYEVMTKNATHATHKKPVELACEMQALGVGEIIVNSIDRDGTMQGYDTRLLQSVTGAVTIPVVACGGAGSLRDMARAVQIAGVSAVAAGSLFVYYGKLRAVLINYPDQDELELVLGRR